MKNVVLTTEYFGPVSSYYLINNSNLTYIEYFENYQKKSYRNRCKLSSSSGVVLLSVPLKSGKSKQCPISEVEISYEKDWISEHLQAMLSCYGKSPFYEFYIDDIASILRAEYSTLLELNESLHEFLLKALGIETNVTPTSAYNKVYNEETLDLRKYHYSNRSKLHIEFKEYWQVWSDRQPFISDLSILDLLCCKGPEGIFFLSR